MEAVSDVAQRPPVQQLFACLVAYVFVLLVTPLGHHDLVCHIETHAHTHCTSCTSSQPGFATGVSGALAGRRLACAGRAYVDSRAAGSVLTPIRLPGRAPPCLA
jgi:hypothetical protein